MVREDQKIRAIKKWTCGYSIFSGILVDRETSSLEIEKYIRERDTLHEVHQEIWAALLFTAGPAKFANLVLDFTHFDSINSINEEYEQRLEKGFLEHLSHDYLLLDLSQFY